MPASSFVSTSVRINISAIVILPLGFKTLLASCIKLPLSWE